MQYTCINEVTTCGIKQCTDCCSHSHQIEQNLVAMSMETTSMRTKPILVKTFFVRKSVTYRRTKDKIQIYAEAIGAVKVLGQRY